MERRPLDVSLSALQMGILRSYSQLIQPSGTSPPHPSYNPRISDTRKTLAEPFRPYELNPIYGAFQPYVTPVPMPSETLLKCKTGSTLLHPLVSGSNGFHQRRTRGEKKAIPEEQKDDRYFERRKRNNQAAKKSRDARKLREDQIALRAAILEHENAMMRAQILTLREETQALRGMLLLSKKNTTEPDQSVPMPPGITTPSQPFLDNFERDITK